MDFSYFLVFLASKRNLYVYHTHPYQGSDLPVVLGKANTGAHISLLNSVAKASDSSYGKFSNVFGEISLSFLLRGPIMRAQFDTNTYYTLHMPRIDFNYVKLGGFFKLQTLPVV